MLCLMLLQWIMVWYFLISSVKDALVFPKGDKKGSFEAPFLSCWNTGHFTQSDPSWEKRTVRLQPQSLRFWFWFLRSWFCSLTNNVRLKGCDRTAQHPEISVKNPQKVMVCEEATRDLHEEEKCFLNKGRFIHVSVFEGVWICWSLYYLYDLKIMWMYVDIHMTMMMCT